MDFRIFPGPRVWRRSLMAGASALTAMALATTLTVAAAAPNARANTPPPVGVAGSWQSVLDENFNGDSLDPSVFPDCHWATGKGCTGQNPEELQQYRPENVDVSNGVANLSAKRQSVRVPETGSTKEYTSGSISTGPWKTTDHKPTFEFQYGYVEARVRMAPGQGVWSTFWLQPSNLDWPPEVNIAEAPNFSPTKLYSNVHFGTAQDHQQSTQAHTGPDWSNDFHVFGLQWTSTSLTWFIDGQPVRTVTDPDLIPHQPMYPVLNVSVGGWARTPPPSTAFPATTSVDYLRVWQRPV